MTRISINGYRPGHLSFSTINGYRMCGAKFNFEKVLKLEQKPGLAAIGGNAVHVVSEAYDKGEWTPSPSGGSELDNVRNGAENGLTDHDGSAA